MSSTLARNNAGTIARELLGFDPFAQMRNTWQFDYDVTRTESGYDIEVPVPGFNGSQIDVFFQDGTLAINGKNDRRSFTKSFTVPDDVDPDNIEAHVQDGMLCLQLHRRPEAQPKRINVK
jgi:HSP20 family protein